MDSASGRAPSIAVVGDALIDELRGTGDVREFVGGAALNVAVGLATLGLPTTLIAMVGDDADGDRIRGFLREHGVGLRSTPSPRGSSRAVSERIDGEPRYLFNDAARNRHIDFDDAQRAAIDDAALVVVSCFPFDEDAEVAGLLDAVACPERRLIVDPNPREAMMRDRSEFTAGFERTAARSLLTKVGDEDAALLYGTGLDALASRVLGLGARSVLATAGRDGAALRTAAGVAARRSIAALPGPIVDTMGAGDATLASTVASLALRGLPADPDECDVILGEAMRVAAATCRAEGALLRVPPVEP